MIENPEDSSMVEVEERGEWMVSPTGGSPFLRKAHFLKPSFPSSNDEPLFKLSPGFSSSLPSHFVPKQQWPLKVEFRGWKRSTKNWETWVDQMASVHQSTWRKAGIYDAIYSSTYRIRRQTDLVHGLAEKWCCETNTFMFPWGEATITLEDVMVLGGYSVLGDSVLSPLETTESKEIEEKLHLKRILLSDNGSSSSIPASKWLNKFMNSETEFGHEAFLIYWLSRYVFHGASEAIYKHAISIGIHLARGTRIALAPAVLASIYRDLGLFKRKIVASSRLKVGDAALEAILTSPFQLVKVWAWERFSGIRPKPNDINYGEPRMARWGRVNGLKVENLSMVLDSAGGDFLWRPYAMAIGNWNFPKFYPHEEKRVVVGPDMDDELLSFVTCLRISELAGLGTVAHYLPHRVAMQFGFDQDLPCSVIRPNPSADIAWKQYNKQIENVILYLPSRLFEADVSAKYLKWWKQSVSSGLEDQTEAAEPEKKKAKSIDRSPLRANHLPVPPGFPSKCRRKKADNDMVSMVGNECGSSNSLLENRLLEFEKQDSRHKASLERLVSVIEAVKAHGFLNKI